LGDYYHDSRESLEDDQPRTEAYFALRAIGTNALPTLLHWVAHEPSWWQEKLRVLGGKLPVPDHASGFVYQLRMAGYRPDNWVQAFGVLGSDANSAVTELTRLLRREPAADDLGALPALALAYIGPAGLPPLLAAARNPNASRQINAILSFKDMGTNALPAIPLLIQCLTSTNVDVVQTVTWTLCQLRLRPDLVLPALAAHSLSSPDPGTRFAAARWLAEVEAYRPAARRVLLRARQDPSPEVRRSAEDVIGDLPPALFEDVPSPIPAALAPDGAPDLR
jgi:hypothetical protein